MHTPTEGQNALWICGEMCMDVSGQSYMPYPTALRLRGAARFYHVATTNYFH